MVNAMARWGDRFVPLLPAHRFGGGRHRRVLPESRVAGAFHHLPAGPMGIRPTSCRPTTGPRRWAVTDEVIELVEPCPRAARHRCRRAGSGSAVEALTAARVQVNRRYKVHASSGVTGIDEAVPMHLYETARQAEPHVEPAAGPGGR